MEYAVRMRGISKQFPRVLANDKVDFDVYRGEIHALVGENGAGKSTLMNILYGLYAPTEGEIEIGGETVRMQNALDAIRHGIGMVHQHFMLVPRLTVAENIVLGKEPRKKRMFFDFRQAVRQVEEVCEAYSLKVDPRAKVSDISLGMQQRVEIVKTLYRGAEIIILDEPTAVLTPQEIDELGMVLKKLKSMGKTVIIITHKIEEIMNFSDRVTVLRRGKKVGTVVTKESNPHEITRMMVGRDVSLGGLKEPVEFDGELLRLENVTCESEGKEVLRGISLTLKRGEILGICGIDGSGQTELAKAVCGVLPVSSGRILYEGRDITGKSIRRRKEDGIAFIPQDRHRDGLVLDFTVEENLVLGFHHSPRFVSRFHCMPRQAVRQWARELIDRYDIRPPEGGQQAKTLSGGNQQKIIVARETSGEARLIVADQPTRGIDVGAIAFIHNVLTEKRNSGCGVLLVSLELDELLMLSNRVAVLNEGRLVGVVRPETTSREEIGLMMVGQGKGENERDDREGEREVDREVEGGEGGRIISIDKIGSKPGRKQGGACK